MPTEPRLALYKEAIQKIKTGDFSISFPDATTDSYLRHFENDLIELGMWLDQRFREINKLQEISTEISKGSLLSDVLDRIYHAFQEVIPYDRIGCALISSDGQNVVSHWAKTNYPEKIRLARGYSAPLAGSSLELILQTRQPRILNDLHEYSDAHPKSNPTKLILAEGVQSSLTCPLIADEKPIGFLFFSSLEKNTYRDSHQKIFVYIAQQVSILIEKSRLYQQVHELNHKLVDAMALLKEQTCRDSLTGVYHRGAIMEFMDQTLHAGIRKQQPVSVIMADLDNFKAINDNYGHLVGDTVLQQTAKTMVHHLRTYDHIGRYGGEEFLIILDDTDATEAVMVAERIRRAIAKLEFESGDESFAVTISMGIVTTDNVTSMKSKESLLSEADRALYHAKDKGRNRVVIA